MLVEALANILYIRERYKYTLVCACKKAFKKFEVKAIKSFEVKVNVQMGGSNFLVVYIIQDV